jgi:hypothetical protein
MSQPKRASDVEPEIVDWLWGDRIPRGMLSLVAGKPDQGKGLFAVRVAADVTQNGGRVLYSAAEDSHSMMTVPRLRAAGADDSNVLLWRFQLPKNGRELGQLIVEQEIDLVVIDPIASHLSGGVRRHSDNVRTVLGPLTELIEQTKTAVLIVDHALKNPPKSGHPLDCIGGSGSGIPAACRAAYILGRDPDDEDRRILAPAKFNVGPFPASLAFEIDTEIIGGVGEFPFLVEDEELMVFDPMRLFESKKQAGKAGRPPDKRAAAAEWLTTYLAEAGGPVKSTLITEDAKQYGLSGKTLRRAAADMEVVKDPPGGGPKCTWDLPDDVKEMLGLEVAPKDEDEPTEAPVQADSITDDDLVAFLNGGEPATELMDKAEQPAPGGEVEVDPRDEGVEDDG